MIISVELKVVLKTHIIRPCKFWLLILYERVHSRSPAVAVTLQSCRMKAANLSAQREKRTFSIYSLQECISINKCVQGAENEPRPLKKKIDENERVNKL